MNYMPAVLTLPKNLIKEGEIVLLPRSEYEELLRVSRFQQELNEDLDDSLEQARQGRVIGPFKDSNDLIQSLMSY